SQSDCCTPFLSVSGGVRTTISQPKKYERKLHIFGSSTAFSIGVSDKDTIPSYIQSLVNKDGLDIKVENCGVIGMNLISAINNMTQTNITPNIVVFFDFDELEGTNFSYDIDLNKIDRGDDFFLDLTKRNGHFSKYGNRLISEEIYREINFDKYITECAVKRGNSERSLDLVLANIKYVFYKKIAQSLETCEMKSYLSLLESHVPDPELKVGSVAVNCNPITKGHLHLLEHASRNVDKLFIFVIEEDKSFFKFEDRLHLVAESTKHLENVTVLRGGKFICTELTYPD
ncbi:citrate lyase ligase, partial [Vibrio sp. D173a]|nr:citrate lyase ligase [Vibrio sp. D173a]